MGSRGRNYFPFCSSSNDHAGHISVHIDVNSNLPSAEHFPEQGKIHYENYSREVEVILVARNSQLFMKFLRMLIFDNLSFWLH